MKTLSIEEFSEFFEIDYSYQDAEFERERKRKEERATVKASAKLFEKLDSDAVYDLTSESANNSDDDCDDHDTYKSCVDSVVVKDDACPYVNPIYKPYVVVLYGGIEFRQFDKGGMMDQFIFRNRLRALQITKRTLRDNMIRRIFFDIVMAAGTYYHRDWHPRFLCVDESSGYRDAWGVGVDGSIRDKYMLPPDLCSHKNCCCGWDIMVREMYSFINNTDRIIDAAYNNKKRDHDSLLDMLTSAFQVVICRLMSFCCGVCAWIYSRCTQLLWSPTHQKFCVRLGRHHDYETRYPREVRMVDGVIKYTVPDGADGSDFYSYYFRDFTKCLDFYCSVNAHCDFRFNFSELEYALIS